MFGSFLLWNMDDRLTLWYQILFCRIVLLVKLALRQMRTQIKNRRRPSGWQTSRVKGKIGKLGCQSRCSLTRKRQSNVRVPHWGFTSVAVVIGTRGWRHLPTNGRKGNLHFWLVVCLFDLADLRFVGDLVRFELSVKMGRRLLWGL